MTQRRLATALRSQFNKRKRFRGLGFWWMMYDRVLARRWSRPLPWRGSIRAIRLNGVEGKLFIRLGTTDFLVLEEIFLENEYEALFDDVKGPIGTIVDLGANIGLSVRLWRNRFPGAKIVAVEPDPGNMRVCKFNAHAVRDGGDIASQVSLVQACVVGRARAVSLDRSRGEWGFKITDHAIPTGAPPGESTTVPGLTLPSVLSKAGVTGPIDILKCDIEGAEKELFADCREWIGRVRHMVVEIHSPYTPEQFLSDLKRNSVTLSDDAGECPVAGSLFCRTLKQTPDVAVLLLSRSPQVGQVVLGETKPLVQSGARMNGL